MSRRWSLRTSAGAFLTATIVALCLRLFLLEDYRIASDSMHPNLMSGDLVFVNKASFNLRVPFSSYEIAKIRRPHLGEVVAFTLPDHGLETFVKRVVAVEGDRILIKNGVLQVNGKDVPRAPSGDLFTEKFEGEAGSHRTIGNHPDVPDYGPVDVPPGHFFVLGDNRPDSTDSREWGPIPYSCLKGRVALVWLSVDSQGSIRRDRLGMAVK